MATRKLPSGYYESSPYQEDLRFSNEGWSSYRHFLFLLCSIAGLIGIFLAYTDYVYAQEQERVVSAAQAERQTELNELAKKQLALEAVLCEMRTGTLETCLTVEADSP